MSITTRSKRRRSRRESVHKANGVLHPRVQAGFETRIVHPFATKQFRPPADPGNKTDPNDLYAMHRAVVSGFGRIEMELDEVSQELRLLALSSHSTFDTAVWGPASDIPEWR